MGLEGLAQNKRGGREAGANNNPAAEQVIPPVPPTPGSVKAATANPHEQQRSEHKDAPAAGTPPISPEHLALRRRYHI